jgi:hypothetical protein
MFRLAFDTSIVIAVGVFSGNENTDIDFQAYVNSFKRLDEVAYSRPDVRGAYAIIVDPENPRPDAAWRKKIADASADIRSNPAVSLITKSAAIRSVITAVNWFRPPRYEIRCHESLESAAIWISALRSDNVLPAMQRLERECRGSTGRLSKI